MKFTTLSRRGLVVGKLRRLVDGDGTALRATCDRRRQIPVRRRQIVVPFPPGGGVDTLARLIGPPLSERLGQPVVIENKPGAGSLIGAAAVKQSAPRRLHLADGKHVIRFERHSRHAQTLRSQTDFAPVFLVGSVPNILVRHPDKPFTNAAELIAMAKAKPGSLKYASFGERSTPHLAAQLFEIAADIKMTHVPYRGGAPALTAVLGGEVDMGFSSVVPVLPHIREGGVKPVAIAWDERLAILPDVPTFKESGVDLELGTWFGVLAPAGTPQPIVERVNKEISEILHEATVNDYLAKTAMQVLAYGPARFTKFMEKDIKRWKDLAARSAKP